MSAVLSREVAQADPEVLRQSYNSAFEELGLQWHWDRATYAGLPAGRAGVRTYLEREHPHLLRAYDADFLVEAIETARARCQSMMRRAQH
jgi:hypothetical protein